MFAWPRGQNRPSSEVRIWQLKKKGEGKIGQFLSLLLGWGGRCFVSKLLALLGILLESTFFLNS